MNRQPDKKVKRVIPIKKEDELKLEFLPRGNKTICMPCVEAENN